MATVNKNEGKKETKLSLRKKSKKSTSDDNKLATRSVLPKVEDLNETCEFTETKSFPRVGQRSRGQIEVVTVDDDADDDRVDEDMDKVECQVCNKDISHMNSKCRQQHVNRCIDKQEAKEKSEQENKQRLKTARTAVLNCPMCGKVCKTESSRLLHLKKCSSTLGVSTDKMLQLVKQQQSERENMVAAGIVPTDLKSKLPKATVMKKPKIKEPRSRYEEDVQVAMAISSSLVTQHAGDNSNDTVARRGKGKRKKDSMEDVCLLTTMTDDDRRQRMEQKISDILTHQVITNEKVDQVNLHKSRLCSIENNNTHSLWVRASQSSGESIAELFYVGAVMPPICVSKSVPGRKLRRLSSIPGREKSFVKMETLNKSSMPVDDIITVSTQTVAVLAELASNNTQKDVSSYLSSSPDISQSPVDDGPELQASGFCVESLVLKDVEQRKLYEGLQQDYRNMVNNAKFSDVSVISKDGNTFYAHKVILSSRCDKLLKLEEDSCIKLDVSPTAVKSLLSYLYTGELTVEPFAQTELANLAEMLELLPLMEACSKLVLETEISVEDVGDIGSSEVNTKEQFVGSNIDLKEIWGESDSSDEDVDDDFNDKDDNIGNNRKPDTSKEADGTDTHAKSNVTFDFDSNDSIENVCSQFDRVPKMKQTEDHLIQRDDSMCTLSVTDTDYVKAGRQLAENGKGVKTTSDIESEIGKGNEKVIVEIDSDSNDVVEEMNISNPSDRENCDNVVDDKEHESKDDVLCPPDDSVFEVEDEHHSPNGDNLTTGIGLYGKRKMLHSNESPCAKQIKLSSATDKKLNRSDVEVTFSQSSAVNDNSLDKTPQVNTRTCDTSGIDLFGSPTPNKPSCGSNTESANLENESSIDRLSHTADSSKFIHSSTPAENLTGNNLHFMSHISNIHPVISPNSSEKLELSGSEDFNTTIDELNMGKKSHNLCKLTEQSHITEYEHLTQSESNNKCDMIEFSDDDLQITGDNFEEIQASQTSPTFSKTKTGKQNCSKSAEHLHTNSSVSLAEKHWKVQSIIIDHTNEEDDSLDELPNIDDGKNIEQNEHEMSISMNVSGEIMDVDNFKEDASYLSDLAVDGNVKKKGGEKGLEQSRVDYQSSDEDELVLIETEDENLDEECGTAMDVAKLSGNECSTVGTVTNVSSNGRNEQKGADDHMELANESFRTELSGVWDDFHDCGMEYELPASSPDQVLTQVEHGVHVVSDSDDGDIAVADVLDSSLMQDGEDSFVFKVDAGTTTASVSQNKKYKELSTDFKTPTAKEAQFSKKKNWVPPSPFTPMPAYQGMATPALKNEMRKYGVKPVGKKRMVKLLEDIHKQTHQYETDSECEDEVSTDRQADRQADKHPASGETNCPASQQESSDEESETSDVLEESCLHLTCSDSDSQSSPQKRVDVTSQLLNYIQTNQELRIRILMYEPLELDILKKNIKEAGIKCSLDKLMDFLDERCIAFTNKNTRNQGTGRGGGRGRKPATKKQNKQATDKS